MGSLALDARTRAAIRGARLLLIEGYLWGLGATLGAVREAIAEARAAGAQVALTASDSTLVERHREDLLGVLAGGVDILFANADEARVLGGSEDVATASAALAGMCPLVATTDGHKGSCLYGMGRTHNVPPHWMPAPPVDTCGAGDAYAAGVLYALLQGAGLDGMGRAGAREAGGAPRHPESPRSAGANVGTDVLSFNGYTDRVAGWKNGQNGSAAPRLARGQRAPLPRAHRVGLVHRRLRGHLLLDLLGHPHEGLLDVLGALRRGLQEGDPNLARESLGRGVATTFFEVRSLLF